MPSLVLEGGAFRTLFSAGVLDCLLDKNIMFPYCIGVSGGATNCISYISKQKGRNLEIIKRFRNDRRYFGFRNYFKHKSLFGLDFAFDNITNNLLPFDMDTYKNHDGKIVVVTTNAHTGEAEYFDGKDLDSKLLLIRATCAIPYLFPAIEINKNFYYDGAICDPIPIRKSINDGNKKHLIILTRAKGHIEPLSKADITLSKLLSKKYPLLKDRLIERYNIYNDDIKLCEELESNGDAIIIRPTLEFEVGGFERNITKLTNIYNHGYDIGCNNINNIKSLFSS
ncbi:MAG: patatin-like phospholipase family protein [Clostridium sp.]